MISVMKILTAQTLWVLRLSTRYWTNQRRALGSRDQPPPITAHLGQHPHLARPLRLVQHDGVQPRDDPFNLRANVEHRRKKTLWSAGHHPSPFPLPSSCRGGEERRTAQPGGRGRMAPTGSTPGMGTLCRYPVDSNHRYLDIQ